MILLPYGTSPKLAIEYGIPTDAEELYFCSKYCFKDAGLLMTKTLIVQEISNIKIPNLSSFSLI